MQQKHLARWLFIVAGLVGLMVVIGGLTRLTNSGLSMVEWRPITGWLPPLSEAAWLAEFDQFPEHGWDKVMNLNLKAPFYLTQSLHKLLQAGASPERPAKVINIASIDGIFVNPLETYPYAASKAGLIHLTRRMAARLIGEHIVVSGIAPGPFASDMNVDARDHAEAVAQRVPAGRIGDADDMAGVAIFLASRAGDYVVGATIPVDGGVAYAKPGFEGDRWG